LRGGQMPACCRSFARSAGSAASDGATFAALALDTLGPNQHHAKCMGLRDRLARRSIQRRAAQIEERRWSMVEPTIGLLEERVVETPAFVFVPDEDQQRDTPNPRGRAISAFVFLTTKTLIVATVDPPFSEERPGVMPTPIADIQKLMVADNGALIVLALGEQSPSAWTILSLYPDPFSQWLIAELGSRWEESTGKAPEGDRGVSAWFESDRFPVGLWEKYLSSSGPSAPGVAEHPK